MRAFSSGRISVSIAIAVAAFILGSLALPGRAIAREPEYEMFSASSGGAGGGGEWKTDPSGDNQGLPVDGRLPGNNPKYAQGPHAGAEASWAERVESWFVRLLNAVSTVFAKKYF